MSTQVFTLANQLTILRMLLVPVFVLLTLYGRSGWALLTFMFAGMTDLLDGLAARKTSGKTDLGAWLDPIADKLLIGATFIVLTLPNIGLVNRLPLWLTITVISRDVGILLTVAIVNLAKTLGMRVIAEGVETQEQWLRISSAGCQKIQGYVASRPLQANNVVDFLKGGIPVLDGAAAGIKQLQSSV